MVITVGCTKQKVPPVFKSGQAEKSPVMAKSHLSEQVSKVKMDKLN